MPKFQATLNAFAIVDSVTGQHYAHVLDCTQPDIYWLDPSKYGGNSVIKINIDPVMYNTLDHNGLMQHVAAAVLNTTISAITVSS